MRKLSFVVGFLMLVICAHAQTATELTVGQAAPDFTLPFATRDSIARTPLKLSDFAGKSNVILAFYPADWSGGCTKEVCTMRDDFGNIQKLNAEILAISGDYVYSHFEWAKHHDLPFKLVSDHSHNVAKTYNSYNDKSMMNKRTVYLIDKQGKIAYMDLEYSVRDDEDFNKLKTAIGALH
ncbi:MAG: peroxiredoxin [Ignavibacteriales bacterium]|nr:peroxiredoxin [Ignavibacteriales bacterium]MBI3788248.1 peroxiredoxin [Ignavibacteriales bacterium]